MKRYIWLKNDKTKEELGRTCVERGWTVEGCAGEKNVGKETDRPTKKGTISDLRKVISNLKIKKEVSDPKDGGRWQRGGRRQRRVWEWRGRKEWGREEKIRPNRGKGKWIWKSSWWLTMERCGESGCHGPARRGKNTKKKTRLYNISQLKNYWPKTQSRKNRMIS